MYDQYDLSAAIKASIESKEREDKMRNKKDTNSKSCRKTKERVSRFRCNDVRLSGNDHLDDFKQNVEKRKNKVKELSSSKDKTIKQIESKSSSKVGRPRKKKLEVDEKVTNDSKLKIINQIKEPLAKSIERLERKPSLKRKIPKKTREENEISKDNVQIHDKTVSFEENPKTIPSPQNLTKIAPHKLQLTKQPKVKEKLDNTNKKINSDSQNSKQKNDNVSQQPSENTPQNEEKEDKIEKQEEPQSVETAIASTTSTNETKSILQSLKNSINKSDIKSNPITSK